MGVIRSARLSVLEYQLDEFSCMLKVVLGRRDDLDMDTSRRRPTSKQSIRQPRKGVEVWLVQLTC